LELAALKRAFNLARQAGKIVKAPYIPMLTLTNARQGFFEPWEFAAVLAKLPDYLRPLSSFAYLTGWRKGEILRLTWAQVDLMEGSVRLEPNTTKNKGGRLIFLPHDLRAILHQQWRERQEQYPTCPYVFHRHGQPILRYERAWMTACREAGVAGKIPHDFRRTAVRNMVRAGIPERVAMQISGHKTCSIFDRYHIVSEGDLREAAKRLDGVFSQQTTTLSTTLDVSAQERYSSAGQQPPIMQ
jgi:integrase